MINKTEALEFLGCGRIAIVGASDDSKNFGGHVRRSLVEHGIDVVAVNPNVDTVGGVRCYPTLTAVPGDVDGVIVMVSGDRALDVVRACADRGIRRVWLFKGLGSAGAASAEALELCQQLDLEVIGGACPLMFLEPVHGAHRFHRALRRLNHSVTNG